MAIRQHPPLGSLLLCDFGSGFKPPEMIKRRLVVVISPRIKARPGLCTVAALSTTPPKPVMPYHAQLDIRPRLPDRLESDGVWIKGDMVAAVSLQRLDFVITGKTQTGARRYHDQPLSDAQILTVRRCVLNALGLSPLTKHL